MFAKFVLVALFGISACLGATVQQCPYANAPLPIEVRADNCEGDYCLISASGNILFEIDASVPYDTPYLTHSLMLVDGVDEEGYDVLIPVELPEDQVACDGLTVGSCPLTGGTSITWRMDWDWQPTLVSVGDRLTIRFTLYDESEFIVSCFKMPIEIVA